MNKLLLGAALGVLLVWLLLELDRRFVKAFIRREQMTWRPRPRWHPSNCRRSE